MANTQVGVVSLIMYTHSASTFLSAPASWITSSRCIPARRGHCTPEIIRLLEKYPARVVADEGDETS